MKRYLGLVRLRYTLALWLLGGLLVSCGSGEKPEKTFIAGFWSIDAVNGDRQHDELVEEGDYGAGASASYDFGPLVVYPPDKGANAEAEVYVSESGETYWASAESTALKAGEPIGSNAFLAHVQGYRKTAEDATLSFVISETLLEAIDDSAQSVTCPWVLDTEGAPDNDCKKLMYGSVDFELQVNLSEEVGGNPSQMSFTTSAVEPVYWVFVASQRFWCTPKLIRRTFSGTGATSTLYKATPVGFRRGWRRLLPSRYLSTCCP